MNQHCKDHDGKLEHAGVRAWRLRCRVKLYEVSAAKLWSVYALSTNAGRRREDVCVCPLALTAGNLGATTRNPDRQYRNRGVSRGVSRNLTARN